MIQIKTELFKEVNLEVSLNDNEELTDLVDTTLNTVGNISEKEKKRIIFIISSKIEGFLTLLEEKLNGEEVEILHKDESKINFSLLKKNNFNGAIQEYTEDVILPNVSTMTNDIETATQVIQDLSVDNVLQSKAVRNGQLISIQNQVKIFKENINVGGTVELFDSLIIIGGHNNGKIKISDNSSVLLHKDNNLGDIELNSLNVSESVSYIISEMSEKEKFLFLYTKNSELCYYTI